MDAKLQSDAQGFLVGRPMGSADPSKLLGGIKRDTASILSIMRQRMASSAGAAAVAAVTAAAVKSAKSAAVSKVARAAVMPAGRASLAPDRLRDARGRFVSASSAQAQDMRDARAVGVVAEATKAMAHSAENSRREARDQARGADGRFGAGTRRQGGAGSAGSAASAIGGSAANAIAGTEQIDPLLGSLNELRSAAGAAKGLAAPLGRALFKPRDTESAQRADAEQPKQTALLKKIAAAVQGGGAPAAGGGLLSSLANALPGGGALGTAAAGAGAAAGAAAKGLKGVAGGLLKRVPLLGALLEVGSGVVEDQKIANDATLTDAEKRQKRVENAGSTGGALAGGLAGASIGSAAGPVGTVAGAVIGAVIGSSAGKKLLGWVSEKFESGGKGAGTVSTGKGDFGGASYGTHQLSSKTGTLGQFLSSSGYGAQFAGLQPGSPEFNAKWKQIAATDPKFADAQHDFIKSTHFDPQMDRLKKSGMDLSDRGDAVQQAIWSTSVQFGPQTSLIQKALAGRNVASMTDADIVRAVQDYKIANNDKLFASSSANVRAGTLKRAGLEKDLLLANIPSSNTVANMYRPGQVPAMPGLPAIPQVPNAPQTDANMTRLNTAAPAPAPAPAPAQITQDVRDRSIAHVATGGIGGGGSMAHR